MAKIADLIVSLTAETAQFNSAMREASEQVGALQTAVNTAKDIVAGLFAGIAVYKVVDFFKESADATIEWARNVEELSQRSGLSTEAASALTASAREQGVQIDTLQVFMQRLSQEIVRKPAEFARMGIAIHDSAGNLLSMQQIAENTVKGLESFRAGTDRAAAGTALLGRGAGEIVGQLGRIGDTFKGMDDAANLVRALGLEVDENGIQKAREWEKAEADLGLVFEGIKNQIGKALLPEIKDLADEIVRLTQSGDIKRWGEDVADTFHLIGITARAVLTDIDLLIRTVELTKSVISAPSRFFYGLGHPEETDRRESLLAPLTAEHAARLQAETAARDAINAALTAGTEEGGRRFTGDLAGGRGRLASRITDAQKATEEFVKLSAQMQEQTGYENALSLAYGQGDAAVLRITEAQKAYEAAVRLGKGATQEQLAAVEQTSLKLQAAEDRVKAAQKAQQELNQQIAEANNLYEQSVPDVQKYEKEIDQLNQLLEHGQITMQVYQGAISTVNKEIEDAATGDASGKDTVAAGLAKDLTGAGEKLMAIFEGGKKSAKDWHDALIGWILDLDKTLTDTLLKDLVEKPLENWINSFVTGSGGALGGLFSSGATSTAMAAGSFESGGIIGLGGSMTSVSPYVFAGAPRFAGGGIVGLGADEVPIIAHRGERVIPVNQVGRDGGVARPLVFSPVYNINTPNADSFMQSQGQIMADAHRHMTIAARRNA